MTNALLTCVTCNNIFRNRTELTYHVKRHHQSSVKIKFGNGHVTEVKKGEDGMFKCMCEKRFKAPTSLRQHAKNCNVELAEPELSIIESNNWPNCRVSRSFIGQSSPP
jgi:uncharacterized C2H2 Zn-finger protein